MRGQLVFILLAVISLWPSISLAQNGKLDFSAPWPNPDVLGPPGGGFGRRSTYQIKRFHPSDRTNAEQPEDSFAKRSPTLLASLQEQLRDLLREEDAVLGEAIRVETEEERRRYSEAASANRRGSGPGADHDKRGASTGQNDMASELFVDRRKAKPAAKPDKVLTDKRKAEPNGKTKSMPTVELEETGIIADKREAEPAAKTKSMPTVNVEETDEDHDKGKREPSTIDTSDRESYIRDKTRLLENLERSPKRPAICRTNPRVCEKIRVSKLHKIYYAISIHDRVY